MIVYYAGIEEDGRERERERENGWKGKLINAVKGESAGKRGGPVRSGPAVRNTIIAVERTMSLSLSLLRLGYVLSCCHGSFKSYGGRGEGGGQLYALSFTFSSVRPSVQRQIHFSATNGLKEREKERMSLGPTGGNAKSSYRIEGR